MFVKITRLCESEFTKVTVESLVLMDSSDVSITISTVCEGGFTKVTVESLTMMGRSDVHITTSVGCEGSVTYTAAIYFLHFYINTGELLMV